MFRYKRIFPPMNDDSYDSDDDKRCKYLTAKCVRHDYVVAEEIPLCHR